MCVDLAGLREAVRAYASGFDPALVAPGERAAALQALGAIEKTAAALACLLAAHTAAASPPGSQAGVADLLARASGTSRAAARRAMETAGRLAAQPEVAEAVRSGRLSWDQAELVSKAAEAAPSATGELLDLAQSSSLGELAEQVVRTVAQGADLEARRRRCHEQRALRSWSDAEGTWHLHASGPPEQGAKVMAAVQRLADACFEEARSQGRRERPEAYAFDGLVRLATLGPPAKAGYEVMVRVDLDALLRGRPLGGETCELAGYGPVPVSVVQDIMATEDPFLKAVVTKGKAVAGVAHLGRRPNAHQRSALDWLYPTCAVAGCGVRATCLQTDHRAEWAKTHLTVVDLLDRLCRRHHALKTYQGWALVEGRGKRDFVPPGDPRHPGTGARVPTGPPTSSGSASPAVTVPSSATST